MSEAMGALSAAPKDTFGALLKQEPELREWLIEQTMQCNNSAAHEQPLSLIQGVSPRTLCLSSEVGALRFTVPVQTDRPPPRDDILSLMQNLGISPRQEPEPLMLGHDDQIDCVAPDNRGEDSISSFYIPQRTAGKNWVLGSVVHSALNAFGFLLVLGVVDMSTNPAPYKGRMAKFMANRLTGELYQLEMLENGMVVVWRDSHLMTRFEVLCYAAGESITQLGPLLRSGLFASMLDCVKCCSLSDGSHGSAARFALCRCVNPTHPVVTRPFDSWEDFAGMCCSTMREGVTLKTVFDADGVVLDRAVSYYPARFVRTTSDALPLFATLILNHAFSSIGSEPSTTEHDGRVLLLKLEEDDCLDHDPICATSREHGREFRCDQCERVFSSRFNLKRHIRSVHENDRAFECDLCGHRFKLKTHLISHIRLLHVKDKPYACEYCSQQFSLPSNLRRHVNGAHLRPRQFQCSVCLKQFPNKFNLERHVANVHTRTQIQLTDGIS